MTLLVLILGLIVPCALMLIIPGLPSMRRMAKVDRPKQRRVHISPPVLVIDEKGESEFRATAITPGQARAQTFPLWWMRQPMRTDDQVQSVDVLALSPVAVIQEEMLSAPLPEKPARFRVRNRAMVISEELTKVESGGDP